MKRFLLALIVIAAVGVNAQDKPAKDFVPTELRQPSVPTLESLKNSSEVELTDLVKKSPESENGVDEYSLEGEKFSGWASQIFPDDVHRYRFTQYENGEMIRQIGYYANGMIDHDFHQKSGSNSGSQRMWREDGTPYIDTFFTGKEIMHGLQMRWHPGWKLARQALYDQGTLVYEVLFDTLGNITEQTGEVPEFEMMSGDGC